MTSRTRHSPIDRQYHLSGSRILDWLTLPRPYSQQCGGVFRNTRPHCEIDDRIWGCRPPIDGYPLMGLSLIGPIMHTVAKGQVS